jgi:pimeloyl-[acyl-carrier protein] methyl ester esterase
MKTVVLLHGWGMNPAVFDGLAAELGERHVVCAPALPGYGSSRECESYTLAGLVREMSASAPERCDVIGWSLGAHVALHWARTRPQQVARLAVIAATPCFVRRGDWHAALDASTLRGFADALAHDAQATLDRFIFLQAQGDGAAKRVMQMLRATLSAHALPSSTVLAAGLEILRDEDLRVVLGEIAQHTLVVHGENDQLVPLTAARELAQRLPRARLEIIAGAAHAPFVSSPEIVSRLLAEHFDER